MPDVRKAISLITGSEPSQQQMQRVHALAHSLDIPNNDPLLPILIALDAYHGVFSELPERNRIAANAAAVNAAENAERMVKQRIEQVTTDSIREITPQVVKAMTEVAEREANKRTNLEAIYIVAIAMSVFASLMVGLGAFIGGNRETWGVAGVVSAGVALGLIAGIAIGTYANNKITESRKRDSYFNDPARKAWQEKLQASLQEASEK